MHDDHDDHLEDLIARSLDGALNHEENRALDAAMQRSAEVRQAIETARAIDASLARCFADDGEAAARIADNLRGAAPVSVNGVLPHGNDRLSLAPQPMPIADAQPSQPRRRVWRGLAAAAAIAAIVLGAWQIWSVAFAPRGDGYTPQQWRPLAQVYRDTIAEGFEPIWICDDDAEFIDAFDQTYAQPLVLTPLPENVEAAGITYANVLSRQTTCVLFRVGGEPVIVFVDRIETDVDDPAAVAGELGDLQLRRRVVGRVVLYELSPRSTPAAVDFFTVPSL